jgi:TldD protein
MDDLLSAELAGKALSAALRHGGDFAEVFAEDRSGLGASLDDGRVEELTSGSDRGAGVRVIVGETTGFAYTADLSERGLTAAAEAASAVARDRGGSAGRIGSPLPVGSGRSPAPGPEVVVLPGEVPKARKVAILELADQVARSYHGAVIQVSSGYADSRRRTVVANSDGLYVSDDQVRTRFMVQVVASGDTGMQTGYEVLARTSGFEALDESVVEEVAREAARRAVIKLEARPAPSGSMPVVIKGGSGGILFHEACGHGLEADHIVKGASVYRGKLGERVASELVTLVDDGTVGGEWGSYRYDDEGRSAQRNVLIDRGVLVDYMWDHVRAAKEGRPTTGNGRRQSYQHLPMVRMTNTYIVAGQDDPEDIVASTPRGVYVAKLGGGQVNTATGDFVFGMVEAYLIEDGRLSAPLRDANLIGNGPEVLNRIDAVGNDFSTTPGTCGKDGQSVPVGCGQPTLRVAEVTVGGTAAG